MVMVVVIGGGEGAGGAAPAAELAVSEWDPQSEIPIITNQVKAISTNPISSHYCSYYCCRH